MVRCNRCGTTNEPGARFCGGCGNGLAGVGSGPLPAQHGGSPLNPGSPPNPGYPGHPSGPGPGAQLPAGAQPPPGAQLPPAAQPYPGAHQPGLQTPGNPQAPAYYPDPTGAGAGYAGGGNAGYAPAPLGGYEPAGAPAQGVAAAQALAYAETSPPVYDEHALNRPLPDRGRRRFIPDDRGTDVPPPQMQRPSDHPAVGAFDPMNVPRDAPRILAGILVSYESNPLGQFWPLFQGPNLVGRLGAGVGADVELPHATVSSRHALLSASAHPGRVVIADQGSTNGTFVNEVPLAQDQPRELRDGDRVRLGLYGLVIKIL